MNDKASIKRPVLIVGETRLVSSLAVCLLKGGSDVVICTGNDKMSDMIDAYLDDQRITKPDEAISGNFCTIGKLDKPIECRIALVIANECLTEKQHLLKRLEGVVSDDTIIAINSESIPLTELHTAVKKPARVIVANWVEPAHTTAFLEIITNEKVEDIIAQEFCQLAKLCWEKDPYLLKTGSGIRSRVMAALIREACFLIAHGYSTIEDIDRACRNDAGYYLPFAGIFRYMDLMGTYAFGVVMKDLNPELCKDHQFPQWVTGIVDNGAEGMANNKGFYTYDNDDIKNWESRSLAFSHEIREIIDKYPFGYLSGENHPDRKACPPANRNTPIQ